MRKTIIFGIMLLLFAVCVNAGEFGNKHINPYYYSSGGIGTLAHGEKVCQENNMPKNGTIIYWCPSFYASGDDELIFWISNTSTGGHTSAYQGSTRTISNLNNFLWHDGCLIMPSVNVTKNLSLWFCVYNNGGGSGTYRYYAGMGYPSIDSPFYDTVNYYPRYQNYVTDGRWYEDGVVVNGTPYLSGFIYSDSSGSAFPCRQQYGQPEKIISSTWVEFYFPYDNEQIYNMSMIFKGGTNTEWWQMKLYNYTDGVSDVLYVCNATDSFSGYNITDYHLWSCNITDVNLTRGYYRYYIYCFKNGSFTDACDNSPTFMYHYENYYWSVTRRDGDDVAIDLFDYPRAKHRIYTSNDIYFTLGITDTFYRTECYDGFDNDLDGTYDYPNDPDCSGWFDDSESGETNYMDDEYCVYDWDCDDNHNCYPNNEFILTDLDYECGCVNNQCSNFDTLYVPNASIYMVGNPSRMLQFGSGDFAGLGNSMYNFSSGTIDYEDYYAEFNRTSLKRNQPSFPDRDAIHPRCVIDFTDSYSWDDYWLENMSDSSVFAHWKNQSNSSDSDYYDLAKIDEGCSLDWIYEDLPYELTSFALVGNYIYATQSDDPTQILRFSKSTGIKTTNLTLSIDTSFIDDFADGFVAIESGVACTDEKSINYYNSVGALIWSYNASWKTYQSIMADDENVYVSWEDCSGDDYKYITKLNGTNGEMIWEVATGETLTSAYQINLRSLNQDLFSFVPDTTYHYHTQIFSKYSGDLIGNMDGDLGKHAYTYIFELDEDLSVESYEGEIMKPASTDKSYYAGAGGYLHFFRLYENADADAPSPPPPNATECNDSIDNDGDGFTDYPDDPSCSSYSDDTEAPYDTTQCSDGVDNDLDGFIDMADPSCDSPSDNNEFPKSGSSQGEDECLVVESCILYDTIPYSDDPALHGWWGDLIESTADYEYLGGYSMFLDAYEESTSTLWTLSAKKNITNPNNYNDVEASVFLSFIDNVLVSTGEYPNPFYINFLDYDQNLIASVRLNFTDDAGAYDVRADVYVTDNSSWVYVGKAYFSNMDYHFIRFYFDFDQVNDLWSLSYEDSVGTTSSAEYNFANAGIGNIYTLQLYHTIDSRNMEILFNLVEMTGADETETICSEFELPYYLVEEFNGYIDLCDWVTSHHIYSNGELYITQDIPLYYAQKLMFGTIEAENTRYVTVTYDLNVINITVGDTLTFRLYDEEDRVNFWTVYYRDSGEDLWYNDDGTGIVAQSSIPLDEVFAYKFVIDLDEDEFDIYFNSSKVVSNAGFTDAFLNIETIEYIKITSNDAEFRLDNLKVFASDSDGNPQMPDEEIVETPDDTVAWCGLFHKIQPPCIQDSDCETGDCLPSNKCNRFDMTYCDEHGHTRGNKCLVAGISSCVLESTADLILKHFLLFLVFLILFILVAYLLIMSKTK